MKNGLCKEHSGLCAKLDATHDVAVETRGWVIKLFATIIAVGVLNIVVTLMTKAQAH